MFESLKTNIILLKEIKLLHDVDQGIEAFLANFSARPPPQQQMCEAFITGFKDLYLEAGGNNLNVLARTWIDALNPPSGGQQG